MHLLEVATGLIKTNTNIISTYYTEYLALSDFAVVGRLIGECGNALDIARPLLDAVLLDLNNLGNLGTVGNPPSATWRAHAHAHAPHSTVHSVDPVDSGDSGDLKLGMELDTVGGLVGLRLNWTRCLAVCYSLGSGGSGGIKACAAWSQLAARMQYVIERCTYKDSIESLLVECVYLHPAGWYRAALLSSFSATLTDPHIYSAHTFALFSPLTTVLHSAHPDCPAEIPELSKKAGVIANTMMTELGAFVVTLVKFLWDNISTLERQYMPIEVAKRIERGRKGTTITIILIILSY
jgi:hypothetical protein